MMLLRDFKIGGEFTTDNGDKKWRCTDIGTRIITAIRLDWVDKTTLIGGKYTKKYLNREQAEAEGWFNGPPYAVAEIVFDEDDQKGCAYPT